eukprot:Nk52_evm1s2437 gene=Nk52_evmTU1s2437
MSLILNRAWSMCGPRVGREVAATGVRHYISTCFGGATRQRGFVASKMQHPKALLSQRGFNSSSRLNMSFEFLNKEWWTAKRTHRMIIFSGVASICAGPIVFFYLKARVMPFAARKQILLAETAEKQGDFEKALIHLRRAHKECEKVVGANSLSCLVIIEKLADVCMVLQKYKEAEMLLKRGVQIQLSNGYAEDCAGVIDMSIKLSKIMSKKNRFDEALKGLSFCEENIEKSHSDNDTLKAMLLEGYGTMYYAAGDLERAQDCFEKVEIMIETLKDIHPSKKIEVCTQLAIIHIEKKSFSASEEYAKKALQLAKEGDEVCLGHVPTVLYVLSQIVLSRDNNVQAAKMLLDQAKEFCEKSGNSTGLEFIKEAKGNLASGTS